MLLIIQNLTTSVHMQHPPSLTNVTAAFSVLSIFTSPPLPFNLFSTQQPEGCSTDSSPLLRTPSSYHLIHSWELKAHVAILTSCSACLLPSQASPPTNFLLAQLLHKASDRCMAARHTPVTLHSCFRDSCLSFPLP